MKYTLLALLAPLLVAGPSFASGFSAAGIHQTSRTPITSVLSPAVQVKNAQRITDCYPVHRIANDFDYCTNTPVLH